MSELRIDCHTHLARCRHAEGTAADYVRAARDLGLDVLAITDHLPFPGGAEAGYSMAEDELPAYLAEVEALRGGEGPAVLLGIEADWLPGVGDRLAALRDARPDVVVGSVHVLDGWAFDDPAEVERYRDIDVGVLWTRYFEVLAEAARSGLFDVMAHPDLVKKFGYVPDFDVEPLYAAAAESFAEAGVAVEVNTAGLRKPCAEIYPALGFLRACRAAGVPATVGSDAHRPEEVGRDLPAAARLLRDAGYDRVVFFRDRVPVEVPLGEARGSSAAGPAGRTRSAEGTAKSDGRS